jgi:hypothetical protein
MFCVICFVLSVAHYVLYAIRSILCVISCGVCVLRCLYDERTIPSLVLRIKVHAHLSPYQEFIVKTRTNPKVVGYVLEIHFKNVNDTRGEFSGGFWQWFWGRRGEDNRRGDGR